MMKRFEDELVAARDETYRAFMANLLPTVPEERLLGVRMPQIRAIAKRHKKDVDVSTLLAGLPNRYYEEDLVLVCLLNEIKPFDACLDAVERLLPFVDNWAVCDALRPKCFAAHKDELLPHIERWMTALHPYTVRFGMEMLMVHYLDDAFEARHLALVAGVRSEEYYVNMMAAWYFATALALQYDATLPYLVERRLSPWVHRKTVQKALESYRLTHTQKERLRALRSPT